MNLSDGGRISTCSLSNLSFSTDPPPSTTLCITIAEAGQTFSQGLGQSDGQSSGSNSGNREWSDTVY